MPSFSSLFRSLFFGMFALQTVECFSSVAPHPQQRFVATTASASSSLSMGAFDFIANAFKNNEYEDRFATASHILVDTNEECVVVQKEITAGTKFGDAARTYSKCPSSSKGGSLGKFQPGQMVPEFDAVVFDDATKIGEVYGPIATQFGYHLIQVQDRTVNMDRTEGTGAF